MKKNIMLLAVNFPPYDGGRIGASIRVYTMAEFLAKNGYYVHVVIPKRLSKNREEPDFHRNIKIHKYFSPFNYFDHAAKLSIFLWIIRKILSAAKNISGIFFVSSVDLYLPFIVLFCRKIIKKYSITTVISSSPPLYVMQAASILKQQSKEPLIWIADIRDISSIHPTIRAKKKKYHKLQEKTEVELIAGSDYSLLVSIGMLNAVNQLLLKYSYENKNNSLIVENGFNEVTEITPQEEIIKFIENARNENKIVLFYAGTGSINTRGKKGKALNHFLDILTDDPYLSRKYSLIIQGVVKNVNEYFNNIETALDVLVLPPVDNMQIRANLKIADVGLNINDDIDYSPIIIAGKVCDYCISELAIIVIFPENADSLKDFAQKHDYKPYFADVFDRESIKKVFKDIADNPAELQKRRFTKKEMEPHSRDKQYKKILKIL